MGVVTGPEEHIDVVYGRKLMLFDNNLVLGGETLYIHKPCCRMAMVYANQNVFCSYIRNAYLPRYYTPRNGR